MKKPLTIHFVGDYLFDIYTPYQRNVEEFGRNPLTVRFFPLSELPENYHHLVAPYAKFYSFRN